MSVIALTQVLNEGILEIRGDGKAGGGLVLAMQSFAALCIRDSTLHVQEWPFFSSARKGAAVRSFIRISRAPIAIACEVTQPHVAVLMDDGAAKFVDFAQGVRRGGTFILNTVKSAEQVAKHYHLSGRVMVVEGDRLGQRFLRTPRGNISVYAALVKAVSCVKVQEAREALQDVLDKRRIPKPLRDANLELFDASLDACQEGHYDFQRPGDHPPSVFEGYGDLPLGAQTGLRLSQSNKTANYAPAGARIAFEDPNQICDGCSYCIMNCPENIIHFVPDQERGVLVLGADFENFCKHCLECVEVCPKKLFVERSYQTLWEE